MAECNHLLGRILKKAKQPLNPLIDGIADLSCAVLRLYEMPRAIPAEMVRSAAFSMGDFSCLLRDFPFLRAWKLTSAEWTVVFVGTGQYLRTIHSLFFDENLEPQVLGDVELWKLAAQTDQWLSEGADLVICELSRLHPLKHPAPIRFSVPIWVDFVLGLPEPLERLLAGNEVRKIRGRVNKVRKTGFSWRFSRSRDDFELFYHRMYLPFVKARHGDRAMVTPDRFQWDPWFTSGRGGLILVTRGGQQVAGKICHIANGVCYDLEMGILDGDPGLLQQGINAFITWSSIEWGYRQGARHFNMGGAHGWRSNHGFQWKAQWGARIVRQQQPCRRWTFLARELSTALQDRLNRIGFVGERNGAFYGIRVESQNDRHAAADIGQELADAKRKGLAGLMRITPGAKASVLN